LNSPSKWRITCEISPFHEIAKAAHQAVEACHRGECNGYDGADAETRAAVVAEEALEVLHGVSFFRYEFA